MYASATDATPSAVTSMSFFGTRRSRQTRVFRPTQSFWERFQEALQDYRFVKLLLISVTAVVVLLMSLQPWQTRFPYREGQFVPDGVLARTDFQVHNDQETQRAIDEARRTAPLVFVVHNDVLDTLTATFRSHLSQVANAEEAKTLDGAVAAAFGLGESVDEFDRLHSQLTSTESVGALLDQLVLEYSQWLSGARQIGILDAEALVSLPQPRRDDTRIEVVDEAGVPQNVTVLDDVILDNQLLATGTLGKSWPNHPALRAIQPWVEHWTAESLHGQLVFDENATSVRRSEAADSTEPQYDFYASDSVLIPAAEQVTADNLRLLLHEFDAYEAEVSNSERTLKVLGAIILLIGMVALTGLYLAASEQELLDDPTQLLALIGMCAIAVGTSRLLSSDSWRAEIIPLMATVIVIAIVHNRVLAILLGFCLCLLVSFSTLERLDHFVTLIVLCVTVVVPLKTVSSRTTVIKVGFGAAVAGFLTVWGLRLLQAHSITDFWQNTSVLMESLTLVSWSLVCCFLVAGMLPFIEKAFGVVTDISLLELTSVSDPLLQELARRAPGTYNHSLNVATIGEAAAEAIGANGLLLRVGAYFHDIGKMLKPEYFIENMIEGQENPHDSLAPAMSALIIIGHVKDGSELAEQHNLPQHLIDFIEQHHGTTLVEYFFHAAAARADEDHRTDADESTFRYPGPRPQSRETGVMMLADAVESASRTLSEPTPSRIQSLVHDITLKRLLDGQFDECGLTMSELRVVQESIVKTLLSIHHGRIKYPDQKTA